MPYLKQKRHVKCLLCFALAGQSSLGSLKGSKPFAFANLNIVTIVMSLTLTVYKRNQILSVQYVHCQSYRLVRVSLNP